MLVMGLDHIQLAMPAGKEAEARAFFCGLLGMEEVEKPAGLQGRGGCWFRSPGVAVHVGVADPFIPAKKAHPAFLVGDLDELADLLTKANVAVKWDTALPEVRRFYADDPFGNRLELIAAADEGLTHAMPSRTG